MKTKIKFSKFYNSKGEIIFCTMYNETDDWSVRVINTDKPSIQWTSYVLESDKIGSILSGQETFEATRNEFVEIYNSVNSDINKVVMINF